MRNLFTAFVTTRPPKEVKGEDLVADSLQELSTAKPVLHVPQDDSDVADRARSILLFDQALTPGDMPGAYGIPSWALDTARTIRAAQLANLEAIPQSKFPEESLRKAQEVLSRYGSNGTQTQAACDRLVAHGLLPSVYQSKDQPRLETWQDCVTYARYIAEKAEERGEQPIKPPGGKPGKDGEDGGDGESDSPSSSDKPGTGKKPGKQPDSPPPDKDDPIGWNPPKTNAEKEQEAAIKHILGGECRGDPWSKSDIPMPKTKGMPGKLENADNPDKLPMRSVRKMGYRRRSELEGHDPVNMHRLLLDGKVFKGAQVRGGAKGRGTILVDMSSSMGWNINDFKMLLDAVPECTVFGYYGAGTRGRWCILGDRGRVADINAVEEWKDGGSNIVDVPCLEKLSRLPMPRIWLSDGGATGMYDRRSKYVIKRVAEICERGSIVRVRRAKEAVEYILTGKSAKAKRGAACTLIDGETPDLAFRWLDD